MGQFDQFLTAINDILWHDYVLFLVLASGVLFTVWSGFSQYISLSHGIGIVRGKYSKEGGKGAITHFQALSAALSATVGLGNIGGVAVAIALGGPGAVFWMWVVGVLGMAIKTAEVTLTMLYRNVDDPDNPHGGPMWVAKKALTTIHPKLAILGSFIGGLFCVTLLISTITGGNMFQAWNVGEITHEYFNVPTIMSGIALAIIVGMVIIGGVKRIGRVAEFLVPLMCVAYFLVGLIIVFLNYETLPEVFGLIFESAFSKTEAGGAFIGGTAGYAILWGMKRALFSSEVGQGSSPIIHAAVKTNKPVREGIVAGLEPFIDTLVVCTITALVILSTGIWNRSAEGQFISQPDIIKIESSQWQLQTDRLPKRVDNEEWVAGDTFFTVIEADKNRFAGNNLNKVHGSIIEQEDKLMIDWEMIFSEQKPALVNSDIFLNYPGATLTAKAFDSAFDGLGKWLVTIAVWLFAISTMISWSYYGEQGVIFLFGEKPVTTYRLIYCVAILIATFGFIKTDAQLDNLTGLGTGAMLIVNLPLTILFAHQAMKAYKNYLKTRRPNKS